MHNHNAAMRARLLAPISALLFASIATAQSGTWTCPDDGTSSTVASNTGTGNETYKFVTTNEKGFDDSLKIQVFSLTDPDEVILEIELSAGTTPFVTIGSGQGIRITDPGDGDNLTGKGTITKV